MSGPIITEVEPELGDLFDEDQVERTSSVDGTKQRSHPIGSLRGRLTLLDNPAKAQAKRRPLPKPRAKMSSSSSSRVVYVGDD